MIVKNSLHFMKIKINVFMQLVQLPECGGFSLTWADKLRKSIAKKNPKAFMELQEEYFKVIKEKGLSENLCRYVWNVLVCTSKGYGFNKSHTLAYSLIALQEMNLAYKYPIIFWNCACLISDAGGNEEEDVDEEIVEEVKVEEPYYNEMEEFGADDTIDENEDSYEEEDCDGFAVEVVKTTDGKKKKKAKTTNYGKISAAIGKIKAAGVNVVAPDINNSTYTFSPDIENNAIRYGLSGIVKVGEDIVKNIMSNRPYSSIEDFLNKVKVNKAQMINLIKSGAFDCFGNRIEVMDKYIEMVSEPKKRITLQNMKMLIDFGLIPEKYDLECRVYNFNKYLKKFKWNNYYLINEIAFNFYEKYFNMDYILPSENDEAEFMIKQTTWDNIYQSHMDKVRPFVKEHNKELLAAVNKRLKDDMWNKYCEGNISKWEMDAVSFYSHEHELAFVDEFIYELDDFESLDPEPVVERLMPIKGSMVPIFKLSRIAGTVLDRDKAKKTVTLLTTTGVVTVKIYGNVFANYDKQLSVKGADGKKHVIEKSWFARGNKIIVCGMRREDSFVAKKYSRTPHHLIELITQVNDDGTIVVKGEREVEG